jgi:hypothetical protein
MKFLDHVHKSYEYLGKFGSDVENRLTEVIFDEEKKCRSNMSKCFQVTLDPCFTWT